MPLEPGTSLGPYEIVTAIGAGGMGEVYRARDTRLGRTVALKVLPAAVAADQAFRDRLTREARAISSVAHPHICTLFDIGHQGGTDFLVMEYLQGETLSGRLARGPLSILETVRVAVQIAGALAAAHRQGLVHRDLKPANVMLTSAGAKLLDFGIAQPMLAVSRDAVHAATAATMTSALPAADGVFGTLAYMAPEVIEGCEADARSDIFAFGAVLFEMLTGRQAFEGDTAPGVIGAIFAVERPSPLRARPDAPAALDQLVTTCLSKDPAERWESAHDLVLHLSAVAELTPAAPVSRRRVAWWAIASGVAAGLVMGAFGAVRLMMSAAATASLPPTRLALALSPGVFLAPNDNPGAGSSVAVSRDGRTIALVASRNGARVLEAHFLDSGKSKTLDGTEGATSPFFSPDGRWVGFFTEKGLDKVSVDEGTVVAVAPTPPVTRGGVWADDGTIYFSPDFSRGLQRVPAAGGQFADVTTVQFDAGESNHLLPEILPGGDTLLFTVWKGGSFKDASIWSQSLRTGERKRVVDSATAPRYVAPGYLLFAREGVLFAAPFDSVRAETAGEAFPIMDGVWTDPTTGSAHYAVARNGTLVFAAGGNALEPRRLVWVDRTGRVTPTRAEPGAYGTIRLSPDASRVAVEWLNDIWVFDFSSGRMSRATYRGVNQFPVWTPDGRRLAFSSSQGVLLPTLFWLDVAGGQAPVQLGQGGSVQFPGSWTPDGKRLAYADQREGSETGLDILIMEADSRRTSTLVATPFSDDTPVISPDGNALAYVSTDTGRPQVYVRSLTGDARVQVSVNEGTEPVWSRRGEELFFRSGRQLFAVPVRTRGALSAGRPTVLFEGNFVVSGRVPGAPAYDIAPDGRFLMVTQPGDQSLPARIEVALNWMAAPRDRTRRPPD